MNTPLYVLWWKFMRHQGNGLEGDLWYPDPVKCHQTAMLSDIFPETDCIYINEFSELPASTGAIVVLSAGPYLSDKIPTNWRDTAISVLDGLITNLPWVVLVACYDSESGFRVDYLRHPNMKVWVQEPKPGPGMGGGHGPMAMLHHNEFRRIPVGYTRSAIAFLPEFKTDMQSKTLDWFFAGRANDPIREDWMQAISALTRNKGCYCPQKRIEGNHLGPILPTRDYIRGFANAKIIPCRPSPCTPETARLYDALEAGCVPIAPGVAGGEGWNIRYDWSKYWEYVFGEKPPFPIINSPEQLADTVQNVLDNWTEYGKIVPAWWKDYKFRLTRVLREEVRILRGA